MKQWFYVSILLALGLLAASPVFAQGSLYSNQAWRYTPAGAFPAGGATVTVCSAAGTGTPCSPTITVYQDAALATPVTNPLAQCTTSPQVGCIDGMGNFSFYGLPGSFTYSVTGEGLNPYGPMPGQFNCLPTSTGCGSGGGGGGGGGSANFGQTFTSQTSVTIAGAAYGATNGFVLVQCVDNSGNIFFPGNININSITFNVTLTFATAQSGYCTVNSSGGGGGGGGGSSLPAGGTVGQTVVNTAPGQGTWQSYNYNNLTSIPATLVQTNQANTYSAFLQDFSSATMKIPATGGFASSSASTFGIDLTNKNLHVFLNALDQLVFVGLASGTFNNGNCAQIGNSGGMLSLVDAGSPCSTGLPAGPTSPNGVPQKITSTPSGGVAGAAAYAPEGIAGRAITGTTATDIILSTDCTPNRVDYTGSVAVAVTLPTAATLGIPACVFKLVNATSGTNTALTVTTTTWTCNGVPTCTIPKGMSGWFYIDASSVTNWRMDLTGTSTVSFGTAALATGAISSGTCAAAVTVSAPGVTTSSVIDWGLNADVSGITGYGPGATGGLYQEAYPTANNVNFKNCNPTGASITPGSAVTLNWSVRTP